MTISCEVWKYPIFYGSYTKSLRGYQNILWVPMSYIKTYWISLDPWAIQQLLPHYCWLFIRHYIFPFIFPQEYAWLIEIQCGSLFGKVTAAQLYNVFVCLETFAFLTVDKENVLKHPRPYKLCQHNENQKECNKSDSDSSLCPTESDLKYKLAR